MKFYPGFATYEFGQSNFLFIATHPTTSLEVLPREDVGADLLAVQLAQRMSSRALIAMMPRDREFGMDMNRLPPPQEVAIGMFRHFVQKEERDKVAEYEKRYAWVASSRKEHLEKQQIYNSFWSAAKSFSRRDTLSIFVHVQDTTLRNFPSLMDVVPLSGLDKARAKQAVEELNRQYKSKFEDVQDDFADFLIFDVKHQYKSIVLQTFGTLNPAAFAGTVKENHERMLKRILYLGFDDVHRELKDSYTFEKHIRSVEKIARAIPPRITYMLNFTGKLALGTKKFLADVKGKGVEIEVSSFLGEVYTDLGVELVVSLIAGLI